MNVSNLSDKELFELYKNASMQYMDLLLAIAEDGRVESINFSIDYNVDKLIEEMHEVANDLDIEIGADNVTTKIGKPLVKFGTKIN